MPGITFYVDNELFSKFLDLDTFSQKELKDKLVKYIKKELQG